MVRATLEDGRVNVYLYQHGVAAGLSVDLSVEAFQVWASTALAELRLAAER